VQNFSLVLQTNAILTLSIVDSINQKLYDELRNVLALSSIQHLNLCDNARLSSTHQSLNCYTTVPVHAYEMVIELSASD